MYHGSVKSTQFGVIGLGTMGANLARNAARNGAKVVLFNRTREKVELFLHEYKKEGQFVGATTLGEFCEALEKPRAILLMVKAGQPVDDLIAELTPLLSKGDILIDGGNSHYRDTARRETQLKTRGIHFIGMGVSGGEEGALNGPSLMPGGSSEAIEALMPLLQIMAADDSANGKCVANLGPAGAGHFVKMVHNGIEYGVMQILAEAYHLLKIEGGLSNAELAKIFAKWNETEEMRSFLIESTTKIFATKDPEGGGDLLDAISESAGQKGTGRWTTEAALGYGVSVPTITAGMEARIISTAVDFRALRSKETPADSAEGLLTKKEMAEAVRSAVELATLNAYAQGFQLLSAGGQAEGWQLTISEIARIWRGGCIIRSGVLPLWQRAFSGDSQAGLALRKRCSGDRLRAFRAVVAHGALRGIPLPALSSALWYYDAYRSAWLPQNLTQAQRDFFGAHGVERKGKPGTFHADWGKKS